MAFTSRGVACSQLAAAGRNEAGQWQPPRPPSPSALNRKRQDIPTGSGPWEAFGLIACAWIIVSGYTSINALVKAELFPATIRATGVGVPYAFAVSVFGGTAEYLALWFKSINMESGFYWYATAVIGCSLLVCWFMRDTAAHSQIDAEARG